MVSEGDLEYAWMAEMMDFVMWAEECRLEGVVVASVDSEVAIEWGVVIDRRKRTKSVKVISDICGPYDAVVVAFSVSFPPDCFFKGE